MISLSRLIKSQFTSTLPTEKKVISIRLLEASNQQEVPQVFTHTEDERRRILDEAAIEADNMLSRAREEAEQIRQQIHLEKQEWEHERSLLAEESRQLGFEQGYQEGRNQGYEEYRQTIMFAQETVDAAKRDYQSHIDSSEKVILDIGVKIAGKILGEKLAADEGFLTLVKRALKNSRDYKDIQLHVHPKHYQDLLAQKEELIAIFPKDIDFYIYPDDELEETSCIIESENGRVDASVDSQLEEIKNKLFEMLESEQ
ncbi:flagellar assembly protein FliH [Mesobacillus boroniphilus]|uniref:Flagellar assembly protein FliH n=1 Tax=Mesobacillus boroniphilus TaxID=308892 RepID=A0A944CHZ7_9BACI|nr:flagellar assembly protein FliH [Mesobacillus boroniphilus]MBS8263459.1 flagellar assembly protein FliH [Mesobacillus boroniphilus]